MVKIGIIVGSTRPGRKAEAPSRNRYTHPHTKCWVIAWSGALRPLREGVGSRASE